MNGLVNDSTEGEPRKSAGTYIVLLFMVILFPAFNLILAYFGDMDIDFNQFDLVWIFFLPTIVMQWLMVGAVALAMWRENSPMKSIGLARFKLKYLGIGLLFLFGSNVILLSLQQLLAQLGLEVHGNVHEIVKQASDMVWWWLAVSITAAVCEEVVFRGYVLTRMKMVMKTGWAIPIIFATVSFASGHLYQGTGGFLLILVYGLMFCGLYVKTGSIWPGIVAHFIQDFSAIFIYKYIDF